MREHLIDFSEELNKRMTSKGVTYRQVALAARVTKGSMVHYKSGNSFPGLYTLVLMAEYLECSVDDLLGYGTAGVSLTKTKSASDIFRNEGEFADYLRLQIGDYMNNHCISIEELSRRTSISTRTIDMYLSVHRWVPKTVDFLRLCDGLGCTPSDLLGY